MVFQWDLRETRGVAMLALRGVLDEHSARRLVAAVGWTCAHSRGLLVLDLSPVRAWSVDGREGVGAALAGWKKEGRRVVVCLPPGHLSDRLECLGDLRIHADLDDAVADADPVTRHLAGISPSSGRDRPL